MDLIKLLMSLQIHNFWVPIFFPKSCLKVVGAAYTQVQLIDPFNKSNIHSFPLLTTYSAFEILLKTFSSNDVNSGKLYILDLLKGSIHESLRYTVLHTTKQVITTHVNS